jgi:hypothetical protein
MNDDPRKFKFGDLLENGWASDENPTKRGYFVRYFVRNSRMNGGPVVEMTDGNGSFWTQMAGGEHRLKLIAASTIR